jgi:hypothetical protein
LSSRSPRGALSLFLLCLVCALSACATATRPQTHYGPATAEQQQQALMAWSAAATRAASLPASRLLYDAKMASGGAPSVPGTLAVSYDGKAVTLASLTGPFGSRVAEYKDGAVTGQDRQALVVDPEVLRSVLAGAWSGASSAASVQGCDAGQCLLAWSADAGRGTAVLDLAAGSVRSMDLAGSAGRLLVDYAGESSPWPARISVRDEKSGRHLSLKLVAVEPVHAPGSAGR